MIVHFTPKWLKRLIYDIWRFYWKLKVLILPEKYYVDPYIVGEILFVKPEDIPEEFDVILALSVSHHFIKNENTYRKLIQFLRNLKGREMFFEPHNPEESQMRVAYKNFENDEFAKFIVENSSFSNFKIIGYSEDGRPLYKIY